MMILSVLNSSEFTEQKKEFTEQKITGSRKGDAVKLVSEALKLSAELDDCVL
jgi:hypothetical protein